jgi:arylsulfatase A-like enzyme
MNSFPTRRQFLKTIGISAAALTLPDCLSSKRCPNLVFILIDDLGWTDLGCYGSQFYETPNIDKLASEGMKFTNAYAASPVCSPTRASIMTGKHPARLNITDWIGGKQKAKLLPADYLHYLPLEEVTLAEAFQQAGYATGFIGKWHLGDTPFFPENQGFDVNIAGHAAGQPASYFYPYKNENNSYFDVPGLENGNEGEYLTNRLTDESINFLEQNKNQPFLLFLSHYAVHTPIQSKQELTEKYRAKISANPVSDELAFREERTAFTKLIQDDPDYAGMIQSTDESVGRIMAKLEELGIAKNTIVIFMSDNGGLSTLANRKWSPTSNVPLRAGKGWLYEGGIREPMIIKWDGVVEPGTICDAPVISMDFYPTMLEMAGLALRPEQHQDGLSLMPLLQQKNQLKREALYWHFPHYHGSGNKPSGAIRAGDFKLIEWFEDGAIELYNLKNDIGEKNNLAEAMPEKAGELRQMLHEWRNKVDVQMPKPNPEFKISENR